MSVNGYVPAVADFNFDDFMYGVRRSGPFRGETLADNLKDDAVVLIAEAFRTLLAQRENDPEPVAEIIEGYEFNAAGELIDQRAIDYHPSDIESLPVGTKLCAVQPATFILAPRHPTSEMRMAGIEAAAAAMKIPGECPALRCYQAMINVVSQPSLVAPTAESEELPMPAGGSPVLTVWYGSMPESNGKSNWTAILRRKEAPMYSGITIACSEYPDRVRYEADRIRHLIGELSEAPDILAYDAGKHSGYVGS